MNIKVEKLCNNFKDELMRFVPGGGAYYKDPYKSLVEQFDYICDQYQEKINMLEDQLMWATNEPEDM